MTAITNRIKVSWYAFIIMLLDLFTPNGVKRVILLSTVYVYLSRQGLVDSVTGSKIEERLHISNGCSTLNFAEHFADTIWDQTNLKRDINIRMRKTLCDDMSCLLDSSAKDLSDVIVNATPEWLRYQLDQCQLDLNELLMSNNRPVAV